ncbi:PilN domain-containing protein [Pseudoduganella violacea]|uniref:Tfp pilus assembly protein PilN n=1 Tax=Pseudoduganella violacea TaxID=1715466 RepID=A0A7W5BFV1_9BURK|nr:PilN domain-containing protein [Pseudoduganella violacea]MBB3121515.1 Tfp pilus assembly protein PilN [Pseudoduganella violacea]
MKKSERYLVPPSPVRPVAVAALVLLLVSGSWLARAAYERWQEAQELQGRAERMASRQEKPVVNLPDPAQAEIQKHWRALQAERDFAWYPVFAAVENAVGDDIELMEFEPDKVNLQIALRGYARDSETLQEFIRELVLQPALLDVHLTHQKNVLRSAAKVLHFEVKAEIHKPSKADHPSRISVADTTRFAADPSLFFIASDYW